MEALNRLLRIWANPSTAYHRQTDGQIERANQEVEQYLRIFVNYHIKMTGRNGRLLPNSATTTKLTLFPVLS